MVIQAGSLCRQYAVIAPAAAPPASTTATQPPLPGDDPRKVAVEAAIARAKARKQSSGAGSEPAERSTRAKPRWKRLTPAKARVQEQRTVGGEPAGGRDPRKAAVEAATPRQSRAAE